jgi:uroporphyrinogen-III synthase
VPSPNRSGMQENKIRILCTRPISNELIEDAASRGIQIDVISFIETEPIESVEIQQEIEQVLLLSATVVFTSMNAVEAVGAQLEDQRPDWRIYTMGAASKQLVKEYFGEESIAGTGSSAAELAEQIVEEADTDEVYFFCGDQRRDEIPSILKNNHIDVHEIEVYKTVAVPHKIKDHYDAVLFFSPSAVQSFYSHNKSGTNTILFAIGKTTAAEIKKYSPGKIIIGDSPAKENLVREALDFFHIEK